MKKILYIICMLFVLYSCNNKNTDNKPNEQINISTINVSPRDAKEYAKLSSFVDSIICIRLNENSEELIGEVHSVVIRNKYIYLFDKTLRQILLFDKKGNYVSKLDKYGDGPDSYLVIGCFFVDSLENYIDIIDPATKKIIRYSTPSFEMISIESFPFINFNSCARNNNIYYFATQQLDNIINKNKTNSEFIIYTKDGVINNFFNKKIDTNNKNYSPGTESILESDNGFFYYSSMFSNTIFAIDSISLIPLYKIDFGNANIKHDLGELGIEEQMDYINNMHNVASFPIMTINNNDFMCFTYYYKTDKNQKMFKQKDLRQYLYVKDTKEIIHVKEFVNDISKFPQSVSLDSYYGCVHNVYSNGCFVEVIIPSKYLESIGEESVIIDGIGEITSEDDPIVVLMKSKKNL